MNYLQILFHCSKWLPLLPLLISKLTTPSSAGSLFSRGPSNYPIWSAHIQSTLQSLSVWGFINGSITHDATATEDQTKWITIDKRVCGIIANILNDSLLHNVSYDYVSTATGASSHPSVAKAIWDKMAMLFSSWGLSGQFHLFHQALCLEIHTHSANEDINQIKSFFEQMTTIGLDLSDFFHAIFLLICLPHDFFSFCLTVSQTIAPNDFTVDTIIQRILSEINLHTTGQPLQSCISNVENEPVSCYSANWTNVIQKGPPHNNQWRCPDGQTNPSFQPSGTSGGVHLGSQ